MNVELQTLMRKVGIRFGYNIKEAKELKLLREDIALSTERSISYSTLRRLFGFLPFSNPSINTLNTLSLYIGYDSFFQFKKKELPRSWGAFLSINRMKRKKVLEEEDIQFLISINDDPEFCHYFMDIFNYFLFTKNEMGLSQLFHPEILEVNWNDQLKLSNTVIMMLRGFYPTNIEITMSLLENPLFRKEYFYNFIDYNQFHAAYPVLLRRALELEDEQRHRIFIRIMLAYIDVLLGNEKQAKLPSVSSSEYEELYPIVKGRYWVYQLLGKSVEEQDELFLEILEAAIQERNKSLFFHEIIPVLILIERVDLIEQTYTVFYDDIFEVRLFSTYTQQNMYQIGLSLVSLKQGELEQAKRELNWVDIPSAMDSYISYVKIFHLLAKYQTVGNDKLDDVENEYLELVKRLQFSLFTKELIRDYRL